MPGLGFRFATTLGTILAVVLAALALLFVLFLLYLTVRDHKRQTPHWQRHGHPPKRRKHHPHDPTPAS
jgi:hypothetical protein